MPFSILSLDLFPVLLKFFRILSKFPFRRYDFLLSIWNAFHNKLAYISVGQIGNLSYSDDLKNGSHFDFSGGDCNKLITIKHNNDPISAG